EKEPVVGQNYEVAYARGVGKVKSELTQDEAQKLNNSQSKSRSL
ncbi:conjugal transfer protein TraB, partial [Escherichia coli]|nr:conjugal transfer protein TraB [Escherichia coli]